MVNRAKLKGVLAENGCTVKELAKHLGISRQAMSKKLNGKTDFSLSDVVAVASKLGLSDAEVHYIFLNSVTSSNCREEAI